MYEFDTTYSYPNHGKSIKKQMFGHKSIDYPLPIILSIYIDNSCMFFIVKSIAQARYGTTNKSWRLLVPTRGRSGQYREKRHVHSYSKNSKGKRCSIFISQQRWS